MRYQKLCIKLISSQLPVFVTIISFYLVVTTVLSSCKIVALSKGEEYSPQSGMDKVDKQEFLMTRDPRTGTIPAGKLLAAKFGTENAKEAARAARIQALNWTERGPSSDTIGVSNANKRGPNWSVTSGRVRAVLIDSLDPSKRTVFIGTASGGLWKTTNITSSPANWILINDFLSNLAITGIAQDPRVGSQNNMYLCTGERRGGGGTRGVGLFKSTDGGNTWNYLTSTSNSDFTFCNRILCDYAGNVYVATSTGLFRSINGGANWTNIGPLSGNVCDIEISSQTTQGKLHLVYGGSGSPQSYYYCVNPASATTSNGWLQPSSSFTQSCMGKADITVKGDTLYAIPADCTNGVPNVYKSVNGGSTWNTTGTLPTVTGNRNFAGNQGWYALMARVNPVNANECIVGGLDCIRTTNGGITWTQISSWVTTQDNYMHADHHEMQWWDNGNKLLFGNDGGVYYSINKGTTIRDRNIGLRVKQFYSVESHPTTTNYFIGGTQDNGNHLVNTTSMGRSIEVKGGDGAYVTIDQNEPLFQFIAQPQIVIDRSIDGGTTWLRFSIDTANGFFINPFDYDNQGNRLYSSHSSGNYYRWDNPQTAANLAGVSGNIISVNGTGGFGSQRASAIHVSPYTANRVFFGLHQGGVRRVSNAHLSTPTSASITPPEMSGINAYVNCVTTGSTENNLMVIYSNYGVNNIWVSSNGGTTWTACDGNLPDMPVRWAIFHPDTDGMAIIATETGVWETELLDGSNTVWTPSPNFPNVRVDMLHYRAADRLIVAGTHGRGMWSSLVPITRPSFSFDNPPPSVVPCPAPFGMTVRLGTNPGGGWGGNISLSASGVPAGALISYSRNPVPVGDTVDVRLLGTSALVPGVYRITITGTGAGVAAQTRQLTYEISTDPLEITRHPDDKTICGGSTALFSVTATGGDLSYQWQRSTNNGSSWTDITGATVSVYITGTQLATNSGDTYRCKIISSCTNETKYTRAAKLTVNSLPATAITPSSATNCAEVIQRLVIAPNILSSSATYINNIAKDIPDNNVVGVTNAITVGGLPSGAIITGIRVSMNLIHTYAGDLVVNLRAPNGQTINLVNRLNNGTGTNNTDNFISTVFDSTFNTALSAGTAPRTGNFRADKAQTTIPAFVPTTTTFWKPLFNSTPNGDWVLAVADRNAFETGVLTYWSLVISYSYPVAGVWSTTSTAAGTMFLDAAATLPYTNSQEDTIYVKPVVNTTYAATLAANFCAVSPTVASISVGIPVTNASSSPSSVTVCSGSPFTLTAVHNSIPGNNIPPSYQWQLYVFRIGGPLWTNITGANSPTYTVSAASESQNGSRFRCLITSSCGTMASNSSTITVNAGTAITTQPISQNFCDGGSASFSISAAGISLTYQWQRSINNGSTWTDISGATSSSVTVSSLSVSQSGYQYRCVVSGGCAPTSIISSAATLSVVNTATISQQPLSQSVCPGNNATFTLVTNATLNYQWQASSNGGSSWTNILGATSSTLTIASVNPGQSGYQYRCTATGNCGSITSSAATLTVSGILAITTQPNPNNIVCSGGSATLSVIASGATSYQWELSTDGGNQWNSVVGATNSSYTLASVNITQSGYRYRCIVTGPCTTITSTLAGLTVSAATTISQQPVSQSVCLGGNATFSVTASGTNLGYQWQVSVDNGGSWTTLSGASNATLVVSSVVAAQNNYQYRCIITGGCSPLLVTSVAGTLTIINSIIISEQPVSRTVCNGASVSFNCAASGATSYQWQLSINNGTTWNAISGATGQTFTINTVELSQNGNLYRCVAFSNCGVVTSVNVTLSVSAGEVIVQEPSSQTTCVGGNATFTVQASGVNLTYQWQVSTNAGTSWSSINGATNSSYTVASVVNTQSENQYRCLITGNCGTVTSVAAILIVSEAVTISQQPASQIVCQGSPVDFAVIANGANLSYQWQVSTNGGNLWTDLNGENDFSLSISTVTASQSGNQYRCKVIGVCVTVISNFSTLVVNGITTISQQPVDQITCEGNSSTIAVQASGTNLTYQWQVSTNAGISWTNISGATGSSYTIQSTTLSQSGNQYRCIIDGGCGREISLVASLLVNPILTITQQPVAQAICQGTPISFTIDAVGFSLNYQWELSTDGGTNWSPISGATSSTYEAPSSTISQTGHKYRCVVTGSCGTSVSSAVSLTVNSSSEVLQQPSSQSVCDGATASFTTSGGGTNITYQWEKSQVGFGTVWNYINGATSATYTIPSALFAETGTQYRCLISGTCGTAISDAVTLTVNPKPLAAFTTSVENQCLTGNLFNFTNTSSISSGIISYLWSFGDGNTATTSNATYSYTTAGTYTVKLVVTSSLGCKDSTTRSVTVFPKPAVDFTVNNLSQCVNGNSFVFTNNSTISTGTIAYIWRFGDGNSATTTNASYTYTLPGTYVVKLIATSNNGCSDSTTRVVIVNPKPTVDFSINNPAQCLSVNQFVFTNGSTITAGTLSHTWDFGNGAASQASSPTYTYANSGNFTVKLVSVSEAGCKDSLSRQVTVHPMPTGVLTTPATNLLCEGGTLLLTATGGNTYQWYLNGGAIPGAVNATHSATQPGVYTVNVISSNGCVSPATGSVTLQLVVRPIVNFVYDKYCAGFPTYFTNTSSTSTSGSVSYSWNFGNGGISSLQSPSYIYTAPGTFNANLTISPVACPSLASTIVKPITIIAPPINNRYPAVNAIRGIDKQLQARQFSNANYSWIPNLGLSNALINNPRFNNNTEQQYLIRINTIEGCTLTDSLLVRVFSNSEIYVPKGFSPNGDGNNDKLIPRLVGIDHLLYFKVYNRWGQLLYQTNTEGEGWDGYYKGSKQPMETYTWISEGVDTGGAIIKRSGNSILLK